MFYLVTCCRVRIFLLDYVTQAVPDAISGFFPNSQFHNVIRLVRAAIAFKPPWFHSASHNGHELIRI